MRSGLILAFRWMLFGALCLLAPSVAVAQSAQGSHSKTPATHHRAHAHAKPTPHAKAKKRPTVPKKKAVAKHPKAIQRAKRPQLGPRVLPKPNHETLTPVRRVPPPAPVASKPSPQSQTLEAPHVESESSAVTVPQGPTPPAVPEVPSPKDVPSAGSNE